jgi:ATP-dependent RNA helicase SUPV3L1/SUV3
MAPNNQPAAEEFIEVWRPGRRDEHAREPRHEGRPRHLRRQGEPQAPPLAPTAASSVSAKNRAGAPAPERLRDSKFDRTGRPQRDRHEDRPEGGPPRPKRERRPQGDVQRSARGDRGGRAPPNDRPDRDPALRAKYIKGRGRDRDRREPDPNSPFAKLAALKEQLEAGNKEPC